MHLPTAENVEVDVIDGLSPICTFVDHHSITSAQAQVSSTFLANNH